MTEAKFKMSESVVFCKHFCHLWTVDMRTVHLENAATQTFDLFTSKPHRNHALCIPEPKQLSKFEIECLSAQFCIGKLLHLLMDWIL